MIDQAVQLAVQVNAEWMANNPIIAALLVIVYLQYSVRWGAIATHLERIEKLVSVVVAMSHYIDEVEEEIVMEELGAEDSKTFERLRED